VTATVGQVKTALAAAAATITGLRAYDRQPDNLNAPFAFPSLQSIDYHGAMGGRVDADVHASRLSLARVRARAEDRLDTYLGYDSGGIRYAIESDTTLGGVVRRLVSSNRLDYWYHRRQRHAYLMVEFRVLVYT
jgi:hypothetical protein